MVSADEKGHLEALHDVHAALSKMVALLLLLGMLEDSLLTLGQELDWMAPPILAIHGAFTGTVIARVSPLFA